MKNLLKFRPITLAANAIFVDFQIAKDALIWWPNLFLASEFCLSWKLLDVESVHFQVRINISEHAMASFNVPGDKHLVDELQQAFQVRIIGFETRLLSTRIKILQLGTLGFIKISLLTKIKSFDLLRPTYICSASAEILLNTPSCYKPLE